MSCDRLFLDGFINEMRSVSTGTHPRKFCFVLGAGASRSSGIKSGQELVDIWDKELFKRNEEGYNSWKKQLSITDENKYSFYSHYYERRYKRNPSDGYNFLEKQMEKAKPRVGYIMLSYLLTHTNNNVVITTNFDHLTEDAVNYYAQNIPLVIGHEALTHYITNQPQRPAIIKIHRDLLFDPANGVDDVEDLHANWKKALNTIFSEYSPIFVGYAGNDNSLMNYLIENGEKFASGEFKCPYWTFYKTGEPEGKVLEFVDKSEGYIVQHNGFDELLLTIGASFGYKMPSENEFMDDAKKRFQMLADAIDKFSAKQARDKNIPSSGYHEQDDTQTIKAVQAVTESSDAQYNFANAVSLFNEGKYSEACHEIKRLIEMEPDKALYRNILALTLDMEKRYDEAIKEHKIAIELEPDNAMYHNGLGITLEEIERYDEAIVEYQMAIELAPDIARYHNNLADTLRAIMKYDEAIEEYQKAIELESDIARYHNNLADTLQAIKKYDEAVEEYQKAIELEPSIARYHNNLADTLREMKKYDETIKEHQKAIKLEPEDSLYHCSYGITLQEIEEYDDAITEYQKAVELEPDNELYRSFLKDLVG